MSGKPGRASELAAEIVNRYTSQRQSIRLIASDLLLSYSGVRSVLKRAGVEFRPVGQHGAARGVVSVQRRRRGPMSASDRQPRTARTTQTAADEEWFDEFLDALDGVQIRFWVCPIREHRDRTDEHGRPVVTVEWRGDVAHCTYPGCDRTSADDHTLTLVRDEQRKRGWYLSWRCTRKTCDTRGDSTTPTRERGIQLFGLLSEAHLTWVDPDPMKPEEARL